MWVWVGGCDGYGMYLSFRRLVSEEQFPTLSVANLLNKYHYETKQTQHLWSEVMTRSIVNRSSKSLQRSDEPARSGCSAFCFTYSEDRFLCISASRHNIAARSAAG